MSIFETRYRPFSGSGIELAMTGTHFGSVRPDNESFQAQIDEIRKELGIENAVLAQRLGMNQKITDLIEASVNDELTLATTKWPETGDSKFRNFLRTAEITDGVIVPGAHTEYMVEDAELRGVLRSVREQIGAIQIYNADCSVLTLRGLNEDGHEVAVGVLHGALNCLHSLSDDEGKGGGESLLINAINQMTNNYGIDPANMELHIAGGAGPKAFGYNKIKPDSQVQKQIQQLSNYESVVQSGGISEGPRKGGVSIDICRLAQQQALNMGLSMKNITFGDVDTATADRQYKDPEKTVSENPHARFFSNIYKGSGKDNRRNAYTVVL